MDIRISLHMSRKSIFWKVSARIELIFVRLGFYIFSNNDNEIIGKTHVSRKRFNRRGSARIEELILNYYNCDIVFVFFSDSEHTDETHISKKSSKERICKK